MKRLSDGAFLLIAGGCLLGCTAGIPAASPAPSAAGSLQSPLIPKADGSALPPRDQSIATRWPAEIKHLVDSMLALFSTGLDQRPLTLKDVEAKMGLTLVERPERTSPRQLRIREFEISGTRYIDPGARRYGLGDSFYVANRKDGAQKAIAHLQLVLSPRITGFCLDPYELAVYTGSSFVGGDLSPHGGVRQRAPAYAWGMFTSSETGRYIGQGFSIRVGQDRDPDSRKITSTGCVGSIDVSGLFEEKEN